ncbi:LysR family transcriptional regulator [Vibrio mediterranei]|uniref:LysR family transcriptional regulator n=1 Tax=Vibrio mediterranei TaxID=689 RepID=A0A3G4VE79_9VIBR|nr:LysR family transcriptional regulator [Vibrio mediterranei]AYV22715.1 LysR family transcriptional regulator [Vibrio mediterranei]EDL54318.1 regulatory protein, LysR [Vibrio mediterranei AK1]
MNLLTLMRSFISTVEEGSFTGASKQLGVSKSLVSRNIRDLENHLGTRLMNRSTKTLSLTDAGKHYYLESNILVTKLDTLNDSIRHDSVAMSGTLNVLAPNGLTEIMLMPFICEFCTRYPEVKVNLLLDDGVNDISSQGYDVAIRSGNLVKQDLDLVATKLTENQCIVCASPQYLQNHEPILHPTDLLSHRVVEDPNLKNYSLWRFRKGIEEHDIEVSPSISVNSVQAIKVALLNHFGVAMLPRQLAKKEIIDGKLIEVLSHYQLQNRAVYALYRERVNTPRKVKTFIEELRAFLML